MVKKKKKSLLFSLGGALRPPFDQARCARRRTDGRGGGDAGSAFWPDAEHRSVRPQRASAPPFRRGRVERSAGGAGLTCSCRSHTRRRSRVPFRGRRAAGPRAPRTRCPCERRRRPHGRPTVYRDGTRDRRWAAERRSARRAHNARFRRLRTSRRPATRTLLRQLLCFVLDVKPDGRARFAAADAFT